MFPLPSVSPDSLHHSHVSTNRHKITKYHNSYLKVTTSSIYHSFTNALSHNIIVVFSVPWQRFGYRWLQLAVAFQILFECQQVGSSNFVTITLTGYNNLDKLLFSNSNERYPPVLQVTNNTRVVQNLCKSRASNFDLVLSKWQPKVNVIKLTI